MVVILQHQLFQLGNAVLVSRRIFIHHADKRNFRPYHKSQLIAGIIEILGMLVMGQADGICPQLFDNFCVIVMIFFGQSISFIQHVLMTADASQRRGNSI